MYMFAVGCLVSQGLSFKPARHLMHHRKGISSITLPHRWTPPYLQGHLTAHALPLKPAPAF